MSTTAPEKIARTPGEYPVETVDGMGNPAFVQMVDIVHPETGATATVTAKAFRHVYSRDGFVVAGKQDDTTEGSEPTTRKPRS